MKACVNHTLLFILTTKEFFMPDTTPTAPIGAKLYTTPVKAITPAYVTETSGPILHVDDKVVEIVYNEYNDEYSIMFDGYLITDWPACPGYNELRYSISVAVIKTVTNGDISYKLAITYPSMMGNVELHVYTFTKYAGTDTNTQLTKSGYSRTDQRGYQIPGEIGTVVSVDLGSKDSFVAVTKKNTGELIVSSYETGFSDHQVIGMMDYTAWGVSVDNALIDIEVLKKPTLTDTFLLQPPVDPNMPSYFNIDLQKIQQGNLLTVNNIDLLTANGINLLKIGGGLREDKIMQLGLEFIDTPGESIGFKTYGMPETTIKIRLNSNGAVIDQGAVASPYVKINKDGSVEYTIVTNYVDNGPQN